MRGDVLVYVPEESRAHKQVIRKAAEHLRQTHGSEVHESTIEAIRSRIERVEEQA